MDFCRLWKEMYFPPTFGECLFSRSAGGKESDVCLVTGECSFLGPVLSSWPGVRFT